MVSTDVPTALPSAIFRCVAAVAGNGMWHIPARPENTLDQVREHGRFRVGLEAGSNARAPAAAGLLRSVGRETGASPQVVDGSAERLLTQLEQGKLELVIGSFEKNSPWQTRVNIGPPLATFQEGQTVFRIAPVMRNGENAWIALVERHVRNLAPQAQ